MPATTACGSAIRLDRDEQRLEPAQANAAPMPARTAIKAGGYQSWMVPSRNLLTGR